MIRKLVIVGLIGGLLATTVVMPAHAKKKKAKPVAHTLYMEGTTPFGEMEMANVPVARPGGYLQLIPEAGTGEKSMMIPNYVGGPNSECAGNSLMPVFIGEVTGTVVGDMKITFPAMATGGSVELRVWPDITAQACNDSYIPPAGSVQIDLPSGEGTVEATIEGLKFTPQATMMVQITSLPAAPPSYGRAFYGTEASTIEFSCVPAKGSTSCTG